MIFSKHRLIFLFLLSFFSATHAFADSGDFAITLAVKIKNTVSCPANIRQAQDKGEYKLAINALNKLIEKAPTKELYLALAVSLLLDQQEKEAFKAYTHCLEKAYSQTVETKMLSVNEKASCDFLLQLYFENSPELESKLSSLLQEHPDYLYCQFLLAATCANIRQYEPFFYLFYQSYLTYPDSHMAHKTQGVIASLILQRANVIEEKDIWRKRALQSFRQALQLCPQDVGLHRMLIYTASDAERKQAVQLVVNKIIHNDIRIARLEIPFYINHALWVEEIELAQCLLDKAKSWYQYSRILQEMQDLITQRKAKK